MPWYRPPSMTLRGSVALLVLAGALTGCSTSIPDLNARPAQYYEKKVTFRGRISRTQSFDGETLLEVADERAHRVLVRATGPLEVGVGDWVKVKGILTAEARVGDKVIPDVIVAETISTTHAPRFPNLF
jgi:hypothetical protein